MPELIVLTFSDESGAEVAAARLRVLQDDRLIRVADTATLVHRADSTFALQQSPQGVRMNVLTAAVGAITWGLGATVLAAMLTYRVVSVLVSTLVSRSFAPARIDQRFVREIGSAITPGQSALFLLVDDWDREEAAAEFARSGATVFWTTLSQTDHTRLQAGVNRRGADERSSGASEWDFSV